MSSKKTKKRTLPLYGRRLARFHSEIARDLRNSQPVYDKSRDETQLSVGHNSVESSGSAEDSSSFSQAIVLEIPTSPPRNASTRFNIRDVMKKNRVTDTTIADNANEEDSEELDDVALEKLGQKEQEGGLIDVDNAGEENNDPDDDETVLLPSEARIEEIVEIFGAQLEAQLGANYKERIAEMYENSEASKLYSLLREVAGDELLQGIDAAPRPSYELDDDPMEIDVKEGDDDSIEEETRRKLNKAKQKLQANIDDVEMQDAFEKVVHDTLDRKKVRLEDRANSDTAWIFDIMNDPLGENIEDVVSMLTIPNVKARIAKKHSFLLPLFTNPEYEAAFRKLYSYTVMMTALHLRSFTKPETRSTLSLAWALFYGSINGYSDRKKGVVIPATYELGFEPKGDQIAVATAISNEISGLEDAMGIFTADFNREIEETSDTVPGVEFFRALRSTDYNVSVNFVPSLECPLDSKLRCAISGELLKPGESVYVCRFLGLRMADQSLIPTTFRGSGPWQTQNYRDVFRIFYIKQHIAECPPQPLRRNSTIAAEHNIPIDPEHKKTKNKKKKKKRETEPTPLIGKGLSCWKSDNNGGGYYLRYSALLEKIMSFRKNVYRKNPNGVLSNISRLAKDPELYVTQVGSIGPDDLCTPKALGMKLKSIAESIGNKNAHMARDVLATCFCELKNGHKWIVTEKPAYMETVGIQEVARDAIASMVRVSNQQSRFITIFCQPRQTSQKYEQLLDVGKGLLGEKSALPALLAVVKIMDTLFCEAHIG